MFRTHTCGELRTGDAGKQVTLAGWVQTVRKFGAITFVDLRDRYGITQLLFGEELNTELDAQPLGREFVIQATGAVAERSNKNPNIATGDIEIHISSFKILNKAAVPPFTIQDDTDGGDDLRMKYRFLDLRRNAVKKNLELRYAVNRAARNYLHENHFMDIETPFLIKSTPEGARDFVVPSRMNPGQFYALPQSPQTFKQLLMVSGYDRYYQIVKCFRDEDLRADRQPEFTQIDCEMSFVEQEDILTMFEGMVKSIFKEVKNIDYTDKVERMTWEDAMWTYGNDKPDIRFGVQIANLKSAFLKAGKIAATGDLINGAGFGVFDNTETVLAIAVPGCSEYTRKQTDELTEWVKRPQIGMQGLVYIKCNADGTYKSSVDKFYTEDKLKAIADAAGAKAGDLVLVLAGREERTRKAISELRLEIASRLGLRNGKFLFPIMRHTNKKIGNEVEKISYTIRIDLKKIRKYYNKTIEVDTIKSILNNTIPILSKNKNGKIYTAYLFDGKLTYENDFEFCFKDNDYWNEVFLERKNKEKRKYDHVFILTSGQSAFELISSLREVLWEKLGLAYQLLWVLDFPLFEYDEEGNRWVARHHPFTSPKPDQINVMINNNPLIENADKYLEHPYSNIKANAYDMVLNGNEIGGGSIRIYQRELQEKMFAALGMSEEEAQHKFGFLLGAFEYGAPPHGGIAFGFDRLCSILGGSESIRDFIAFPKNNSGRDVMLDAPSSIDAHQFDELQIKLDLKNQ